MLLSDGMGTFKKDCFILQKNTQISIHYNDKYKSLSKQMHSQLPSGHSAWDKSTKTKCLIFIKQRLQEQEMAFFRLWHSLTCNRAECAAVEACVCSLCCVSCCGNGASCIFTHGFPSVKAKWRGALRANTKTGGSGRVLDERKHTGAHQTHSQVNTRRARTHNGELWVRSWAAMWGVVLSLSAPRTAAYSIALNES